MKAIQAEHAAIDLLLTGIGTLATPIGAGPITGRWMNQIKLIPQAAIAIQCGKIVDVGSERDLLRRLAGLEIRSAVDLKGKLVTPGLIDPHTHLVHAGSREHEMSLKRSGIPYLEILAQGGGILSTVRATRSASFEELYEKAFRSLDEMLLQGVTTVEAKSGYGLTTVDELKQLEVMQRLHMLHFVDIVPTFMGAHAIPLEYQGCEEDYVQLVIDEMIPAVAEKNLAEFCDVFCERGVFNVSQSRRILEAGKKYKMSPKIHADEIVSLGGAELAAELGSLSADHLLSASNQGLQALKAAGTIPVLLPGTSFYLGAAPARARDMMDQFDLPVALASDYNPGSCPSESLQFMMVLAALQLKMRPEEILTAVTLNAACAILRGHEVGTLEVGKQADITIFDAPNISYLSYHFGINHVFGVIKRGQLAVWERSIVK